MSMMSAASTALLPENEAAASVRTPLCRPTTPPTATTCASSCASSCGRDKLSVVAILVAVQAIFGGYSIIVKMTMNDHVDALVFSLYRDVGASIVLLFASRMSGAAQPIVSLADRAAFAACGFFGVTISQTALIVALQWVPPFNASLLQPSQPVITLLLALLLGMESLDRRTRTGAIGSMLKVAGILVGCAGATFTVISAASGNSASPPPPPSGGGAPSTFGVGGLLVGNALLVGQ